MRQLDSLSASSEGNGKLRLIGVAAAFCIAMLGVKWGIIKTLFDPVKDGFYCPDKETQPALCIKEYGWIHTDQEAFDQLPPEEQDRLLNGTLTLVNGMMNELLEDDKFPLTSEKDLQPPGKGHNQLIVVGQDMDSCKIIRLSRGAPETTTRQTQIECIWHFDGRPNWQNAILSYDEKVTSKDGRIAEVTGDQSLELNAGYFINDESGENHFKFRRKIKYPTIADYKGKVCTEEGGDRYHAFTTVDKIIGEGRRQLALRLKKEPIPAAFDCND